ncbi:Anti-sigma-K factor rskA [Pedobacter steynii]|uniref:Anti-sigma-K factor rskA n=1 Tax=Pedobacter steynii TaxID=430522 RepID=A0A1H0H586_9SPHI|nr:anti-sigma factor [Pedobacter steynii]NQX42726.1 anti-sigma factor [Pedobacter steynii]SDO14250.1 Anti-sigma-K factor rskA [Pedobacter steynii]
MEEGKAYIESGILELYVLGELNEQEQHEVEAMAAQYPEVKQEISAIELAMEEYAIQHSVQPSIGLANKILEKIEAATVATPKVSENLTPATPQEAKILPLYPEGYESKLKTLRIALIACAVLLIVAGIALYTAHTELGTAKEQIIALNQDKQKFANTVNYMKETNRELQTIADMPNDPDWKIVKLAGTKMDPQAKMMVYWHTSGRHVMVDNSKMGLPKNDQAHQYQLWALVNGKPVNLGVFDVKADTTHILLKMKEIGSAQAFAVTLEKRGGVASPTMDQMIVMGSVSI